MPVTFDDLVEEKKPKLSFDDLIPTKPSISKDLFADLIPPPKPISEILTPGAPAPGEVGGKEIAIPRFDFDTGTVWKRGVPFKTLEPPSDKPESLIPLGDFLVRDDTEEEQAKIKSGDKTAQRLSGVRESLKENLNALGSPDNLAIMVAAMPAPLAGKLGTRALQLGFMAWMAHMIPDTASQLGEEMAKPPDQRDQKKIARLVTDAAVASGMATGAGLGALGPEKGFTGSPWSPDWWKKAEKPAATPIQAKAEEIKPVAPLTAEALKQIEVVPPEPKPIEAAPEPKPEPKPTEAKESTLSKLEQLKEPEPAAPVAEPEKGKTDAVQPEAAQPVRDVLPLAGKGESEVPVESAVPKADEGGGEKAPVQKTPEKQDVDRPPEAQTYSVPVKEIDQAYAVEPQTGIASVSQKYPMWLLGAVHGADRADIINKGFGNWIRDKTKAPEIYFSQSGSNNPKLVAELAHYELKKQDIEATIEPYKTAGDKGWIVRKSLARPPEGVKPDAKEWIESSAVKPWLLDPKRPENVMATGANHPEILKHTGISGYEEAESRNTPAFGYMIKRADGSTYFATRDQAKDIGVASGQIDPNKPLRFPGEPHSDEVKSATEPEKTLGESAVAPKTESLSGLREADAKAVFEWNKAAKEREAADQTPPQFYHLNPLDPKAVRRLSDENIASRFAAIKQTMQEVAGKKSDDPAADLAKDALYRLNLSILYQEALRRKLTEPIAAIDNYINPETEPPKPLSESAIPPKTEARKAPVWDEISHDDQFAFMEAVERRFGEPDIKPQNPEDLRALMVSLYESALSKVKAKDAGDARELGRTLSKSDWIDAQNRLAKRREVKPLAKPIALEPAKEVTEQVPKALPEPAKPLIESGVEPKGDLSKEPWQMTSKEYPKSGHEIPAWKQDEDTVLIAGAHEPFAKSEDYWDEHGFFISKSLVPDFAWDLDMKRAGQHPRFEELLRPLNSGTFVSFRDYDAAGGDVHKAAVMIALREGKPVPSEVLADYPDLAPKPEPPKPSAETAAAPAEGVKEKTPTDKPWFVPWADGRARAWFRTKESAMEFYRQKARDDDVDGPPQQEDAPKGIKYADEKYPPKPESEQTIEALQDQLKSIKQQRKEVRARYKGVKPISTMNRTTPNIERGQAFQRELDNLSLEESGVERQLRKLISERAQQGQGAEQVPPQEVKTETPSAPTIPEAATPPQPTPAPAAKVEAEPAAAKAETEIKKVAATEGQRPAKEVKSELVSRIESALAEAPAKEEFNSITGKALTDKAKKAERTITINIPGDGDFTIINTKENLQEVLAASKRISTTSGTPPKARTPSGSTTVAEDAEAAAKAYGSPEAAYRSVKRQRDELQAQGPPDTAEERKTWNQQIENADYLLREIYGNTKAGTLEAKAESARDRVATYKSGAEGFEKEIARLEAIKKKTQAHKDRLADLKDRYAQNQDFINTNTRNAEQWEQQAAKEKAALEAPEPKPAAPPEEGKEPPKDPFTATTPVETFKQKADKVADALENLKLPDPTKGNLSAFGVVPAVWNKAVEVAQATIRAGGSIADAVDKAIGYIKDNFKGKWDEGKAREALAGADETGETGFTGIRNAIVDQERKQRGLPAAIQPARKSFGAVWDQAMAAIDADPGNGQVPGVQDRLINELRKKPRALTDFEDALILHRQIHLQNEYAKSTEALTKASDKGDAASAAEEKFRQAGLSDQLLDLYNIGKRVGTETGRGLNARRMLAYEDFTLAKMIVESRAARGGRPLTAEENAQLAELHQKIEETQKAFDAYRAASEAKLAEIATRHAFEEMERQAKAEKGPSSAIVKLAEKIVADLDTRAAAARIRLRDRLGRTSVGVDPTILVDLAEIGASHIAHIGLDFVKWSDKMVSDLGEWVKPHLEEVFKASQTKLDELAATTTKGKDPEPVKRVVKGMAVDEAIKANSDAIKNKVAKGKKNEISWHVQRLARLLYQKGIKEREAMVDALHGILKEALPNITRREVMDAFSGYGDFKQLSKDEISVGLRGMKGELQQIGKLQDMEAKKAPAKSGVERRKPTDEERRLIKQVEEAKRRGGYVVTDPASQLRTSLQSLKTRLSNEISDLEFQINSKQKIVKGKTKLQPDVEAYAMKFRRDLLKEEYDKVFGKPEMTDEQRVKLAMGAVERSIEDYERRLREGDLAPRKTGPQISTPELEAARAKRDALREQLQELRDLQNPKKTPEEIALQSFKTRTAHNIVDLAEKLANEDYTPKPRRQLSLDEEGMRLKAENERLKQQYRRGVALERLKARNKVERGGDLIVKWRRGFILSGPVTLAKLTSAAAQRMTFTPIEEAIGAGYSKLFPQVASKAAREGGMNVRTEAHAITQAMSKGLRDSWQVLKTGQSDLDVLYGKAALLPPTAIDFFGHVHGALKAPTKRAEFTRSLEKRTANALAGGVDVSDPMVQSQLVIEAYKDANRSIFQQDNRVVSAYKRALSALEQPEKDTGRAPLAGKALATTARVLLPIVKIPTNIVAETLQYSTGLVTGSARLARAYAKGVENLKPEEADLIMRSLKKGSIGAAVMLLGYFNADMVGGYYQPGEKRDESDVKTGRVQIGDYQIPSYLLHNPLLETLQIGATIRRVADSKLRKSDEDTQGIPAGTLAAALGLAEEVPFVREMRELWKMFDTRQRGAFFGELTKSLFVPQLVQWAAQQLDKDEQGEVIQRKPKTALEYLETGIPGLRQNVEEK